MLGPVSVLSKRGAAAAGLAGVVLVADLASKAVVRDALDGGRVVDLPLGARLAAGENRGAAFGLFAGSADLVLIVSLVAVAGLALALTVHARRAPLTASLAGALLAGGALGNLVDRASDGAVTDYVGLAMWPAFNLADLAITIGAALLAIVLVRPPAAGTIDRSGRAREQGA